jgi:hypothetical protein
MSAINYLTNRLISYYLNEIDKNHEYETIKHILHNKYDPKLLDKFISTRNTNLQTQHDTHTTPPKQKTKWSTFTYTDPQTKFITKIFKNTNIRIAYKTNNTIKKLLTHHTQNCSTPITNKFNKSGIYQLICPDCNMKYIGQTGRSFLTRYQEHFRDYKYNNGSSKYTPTLTTTRTSRFLVRSNIQPPN